MVQYITTTLPKIFRNDNNTIKTRYTVGKKNILSLVEKNARFQMEFYKNNHVNSYSTPTVKWKQLINHLQGTIRRERKWLYSVGCFYLKNKDNCIAFIPWRYAAATMYRKLWKIIKWQWKRAFSCPLGFRCTFSASDWLIFFWYLVSR